MRSLLLRHRPSRAMLVALFAIFLAAGGSNAYAAAVNFLLNASNTSSAQTALNGSAVSGKAALQVANTNSTAGSTPLGLVTASGHQPFTVSAGAGRVVNLNADKLDNLDSAQLQRRVTGTCVNGAAIAAIAASGSVSCTVAPATLAHRSGMTGPFDTSTSDSLVTAGERLVVDFDASGFSVGGDALIGAELVACDSIPCSAGTRYVLATAKVYANEPKSHKAFVASSSDATLPAGTYWLNVMPLPGTTTDANDIANYAIRTG